MTRYYLRELSIEGFRGINNAGDPLQIKLQPEAVNSIHAPNGVGKTSIFEAIHYAIFGEVPRLAQHFRATLRILITVGLRLGHEG
jgi:DNA repair exonuclease SbcCD ATPase subunit